MRKGLKLNELRLGKQGVLNDAAMCKGLKRQH